MIKMLVGLKGSGKTKTLIDEVKKASEASSGSVVCVEYGRNLSYNIGYDVRLVDAKEYAVKDATTLYGFVCGLLASNHDVTDLFNVEYIWAGCYTYIDSGWGSGGCYCHVRINAFDA